MSPNESKILMLKRITRRLRRRLKNEQDAGKKQQEHITACQRSIAKLREALLKVKSGAALAGTAFDPKYQYAYDEAQKILADDKYVFFRKEGMRLYSSMPNRKDLVQWVIHVLAEGIYDLEFVQEITA